MPDEIISATIGGEYGPVQRWLANGGDPNWDVDESNSIHFFPEFRLLLIAVTHNRTAIARLLLAHGADVNHVFRYPDEDESLGPEEEEEDETALGYALRHDLELIRLLVENGAEMPPWLLIRATARPLALRTLIIAGADISARDFEGETPEAYARRTTIHYQDLLHVASGRTRARDYVESLRILEGTRLAGSYKNYVLQEYKELLRLRSLLARKRASIGPTTPGVVARLFGGRADPTASRRATRRRRPPPSRSAGVPGPVFWKVMEYWRLGDWRHPV